MMAVDPKFDHSMCEILLEVRKCASLCFQVVNKWPKLQTKSPKIARNEVIYHNSTPPQQIIQILDHLCVCFNNFCHKFC